MRLLSGEEEPRSLSDGDEDDEFGRALANRPRWRSVLPINSHRVSRIGDAVEKPPPDVRSAFTDSLGRIPLTDRTVVIAVKLIRCSRAVILLCVTEWQRGSGRFLIGNPLGRTKEANGKAVEN